MPRDLFSSEPREVAFVASPESATPKPATSDSTEGTNTTGIEGLQEFAVHRDGGRLDNSQHPWNGRPNQAQADALHPYVQTLSISNLEDCMALENAVFPENERWSKEKVGKPKTHSLQF